MLSVLLIAVTAASASAADAPVVPAVPPDLSVRGAADATVHAKGVQIYTCTTKDGHRVWEQTGVQATFTGTDREGKALEGTHFTGPTGPQWKSAADGSIVKGSIIHKHASPDPAAIPWLLLEAIGHEGTGTLSSVKYIQRLNTTGGVAPAIGDAKEGAIIKVDYTADYLFYGSDATTQPAQP